MKNLATAIATSGHLIEQNKQGLSVEDVFSTYVYTGTGAAQDIVNGIDLATEGGMVWLKNRGTNSNHSLHDTERVPSYQLSSNSTAAEEILYGDLSSFNTDGFSIGIDGGGNNTSGDITSWTFRKAPRFFDVVKYTGNGVAGREIAHDLGCDVGMIITKRLDGTQDWVVWHKSIGGTIWLNKTDATNGGMNPIHTITDTSFKLDNYASESYKTNVLNEEYIAYLFADDPDGPSGDGSDGLIACGSYVGLATGRGEIDLGWEPQYVLTKRANGVNDWVVCDTMRGYGAVEGSDSILRPNQSYAEYVGYNNANMYLTSTGFVTAGSDTQTYIYMAIRRPMRTPESSDEVFAISERLAQLPAYEAGFVVDMAIRRRYDVATNNRCYARLIGTNFVETDTTDIQSNDADAANDYMTGYDNTNIASSVNLAWMFKRAAGFFDVVAYTGDGVAGRTVDHNLGVVPEMMIIKRRDATGNWMVLINLVGSSSDDGVLENTNSFNTRSYPNTFLNAAPSKSIIYLGDNPDVNASSTSTHIAYLFATLPSISKVGSYIGNGTLQTIDCGFAAGAKFVLIKRTDSTGDWWFYDSVRGIVAGNDPALKLNDTAAEVTTADCIDPDTNGFIVNQEATCNLNVNLGEYIFYAISI